MNTKTVLAIAAIVAALGLVGVVRIDSIISSRLQSTAFINLMVLTSEK